MSAFQNRINLQLYKSDPKIGSKKDKERKEGDKELEKRER